VSTPKPLLPNVVGVVNKLVTGVVNAILSPFGASSTPGTPADAPSMWALLAFARREFDRAFTAPSLTESPVDAQTTSETRTLILSAFPAEADAILARTTLDPNPTVVVDGHRFYLGTLGGEEVIVGMTGIGMVDATETTEAALDYFTPESGVSIGAVVFSGVAGGSGRTEIGDVAVPAQWTSDGGETWHAVDADMLAAASTLDVDLLSTDSIGDPACSCGLFSRVRVDLEREPQLFVGGDGSSADNNNGTAFPTIPLGGAIFGTQPYALRTAHLCSPAISSRRWGRSWPTDCSATSPGCLRTSRWLWTRSTWKPLRRNRSPMRTASRSSASAACPTGQVTRSTSRATPSRSSSTSRSQRTTPPS